MIPILFQELPWHYWFLNLIGSRSDQRFARHLPFLPQGPRQQRPAAGRWDFRVHLLDDDGDISDLNALPNPDNESAQRQLCAKCHGPHHPHD